MFSSRRLVANLLVLGIMALGGCQSAPRPVPSVDFTSLGHWEIIRQINYSQLPAKNLKGDIGPAYRVYLVTMAGFQTDSYALTVGPDDDVRYTTDSGQSWTKAAGALHCRHGLDIVDESVAWHCGNGGTRVTTDGGKTWKTVAASVCPHMSFLDAQTGWTASSYVLQATSNGGASWTKIPLPSAAQDIVSISLRTADDGYILDTVGNLFITPDAGRTWAQQSLGLKTGEQLIAAAVGSKAVMRFVDARHGMVVFDLDDGTVWFAITGDGGRSWQRSEIPELRNRSLYYNLFLAHSGNLLTATDDFNNGANASVVLRYQQP